MPLPVLVPGPSAVTWTGERFELTSSARVAAPAAIAALVRELLAGPAGLRLADGGGPGPDLDFSLIDDAWLGAEGYRLHSSSSISWPCTSSTSCTCTSPMIRGGGSRRAGIRG